MTMLRTVPGLLLAALAAASSHAAQARPETRLPAASASLSLKELAASMPAAQEAAAPPRIVVPRRLVTPAMKGLARQDVTLGAAPASALQAGAAAILPQDYISRIRINVEGIPSNNFAPPDTNGAPGATQYVQWVNTRLAIYNKADGALLLGPVPGNVLFAGMTGSPGADACRESNFGDPIVQYDKQAKRWILTQFGWDPADTETGPYYQCIAVSTSPDATGSYYRYALETRTRDGALAFNDYPKLGVWPDAYVLTSVLFETATEGDYLGPQVCGLERAAMLTGAAPAVRCFDLGDAFGPVLPSDLDGLRAPPRGSPNYLMSLDFNLDGSGDHLFLWRFSFTGNTLSSPVTIPVAPFTIACPGSFGGPCVEQPAPGERLDALGDRLMYRLAYRNFGNREALVVNHSVQQPGATADGPVGVRWYELRNLSTTPGVYQQGTWAPDANSRWMGSIGMDRMGNIALGYSVSGPSVFPGVRYTGRPQIAPPGRMAREAIIVNGGGVQVDTRNRWGDYSAMTVDPAGDCRLWYTQQYQAETGRFNWHTRIASLRFWSCW
ncbi:MAG: hypothetical protein JWP72_1212 [Massilia sp.]|nr:hypothetical protein [Massilia sp.]MDB5793572.1 hypothetical protein [Massilia sp.]